MIIDHEPSLFVFNITPQIHVIYAHEQWLATAQAATKKDWVREEKKSTADFFLLSTDRQAV